MKDKEPYLSINLPPYYYQQTINERDEEDIGVFDFIKFVPIIALSQKEEIPDKAKTYKDIILILNNQIEEFSYQQGVIEELLMDFEEVGDKDSSFIDNLGVRLKIYDEVDWETLNVVKLWKAVLFTVNYVNNNFEQLLPLSNTKERNSIDKSLQEAYEFSEKYLIGTFRELTYGEEAGETIEDIIKVLNFNSEGKIDKLKLLFLVENQMGLIHTFYQLTIDLYNIFNLNNDIINNTLPLNSKMEELFNG